MFLHQGNGPVNLKKESATFLLAFIGAERAAPDLIIPISGNYARTATCSSEHILLQMR